MEAESSEMGQVDTEEVDLGSQEAVIDLIDQKNPNYKGNAKQVPIDLPSSCQEILQSGFQNIVVEELEPPIVDLNELVQADSNSCTSPSNLSELESIPFQPPSVEQPCQSFLKGREIFVFVFLAC